MPVDRKPPDAGVSATRFTDATSNASGRVASWPKTTQWIQAAAGRIAKALIIRSYSPLRRSEFPKFGARLKTGSNRPEQTLLLFEQQSLDFVLYASVQREATSVRACCSLF